jgi:hypothetical protein
VASSGISALYDEYNNCCLGLGKVDCLWDEDNGNCAWFYHENKLYCYGWQDNITCSQYQEITPITIPLTCTIGNDCLFDCASLFDVCGENTLCSSAALQIGKSNVQSYNATNLCEEDEECILLLNNAYTCYIDNCNLITSNVITSTTTTTTLEPANVETTTTTTTQTQSTSPTTTTNNASITPSPTEIENDQSHESDEHDEHEKHEGESFEHEDEHRHFQAKLKKNNNIDNEVEEIEQDEEKEMNKTMNDGQVPPDEPANNKFLKNSRGPLPNIPKPHKEKGLSSSSDEDLTTTNTPNEDETSQDKDELMNKNGKQHVHK